MSEAETDLANVVNDRVSQLREMFQETVVTCLQQAKGTCVCKLAVSARQIQRLDQLMDTVITDLGS